MKRHSGFTLIELVIVIVILGILAATALPRFSNLAQDARVATLSAASASLKTGATIAHAMQQARGLASNTAVTYEVGTNVAMTNGYPTASAAGIIATLEANYVNEFTSNGTSPVDLRKNGAPDPTNCYVRYTDSAGGLFPVISIFSSGC